MRIFLLRLSLHLALAWAAVSANAQVTVNLLLDEAEFLRDESLVVRVRVTNRSGRPLQLGQSNDWLSFVVLGAEATTVLKLADPKVVGEFTVAPAQSATKAVDLMPCFDFPGTGRYTVSATVRVPQWNGEAVSTPKSFHIIKGARLWEEEFGVPSRQGAPEMRKYSLVRANGMKQQRLYVRVTDPLEQQVYRVVAVGPMVSFGRPEAQVDGASILHLLFQNGPRSFLYGAITPEGTWQSRLTFDYSSTRPTLRMSDEGKVLVVGGVRRVVASDLAPPARTEPVGTEPKGSTAPLPPAPAAVPKSKDDQPAKP